MRKQTKIAAITSAAALLAIGASMTAFAEWRETTPGSDEWVFVDRYGDPVTEEGWHRGNPEWTRGSQYMYFADEEGIMLRGELFQTGQNDDWYYVHPEGYRATNEWVTLDADPDYEMADESVVFDVVSYYFDSQGRAIRSASEGTYKSSELIQDNGLSSKGKFVFDDLGVMQLGLVENVDGSDVYYCVQSGDNYSIGLASGVEWNYVTGQALNGWAEMDILPVNDIDPWSAYDTDRAWYYFDGCKMYRSADLKQINNVYYSFDVNGVMSDEAKTVSVATASSGESASYDVALYTGGKENWSGSNDFVNYKDDDWYYVVNIRNTTTKKIIKRGVIFNSEDGNKASRMINVNGKLYMIGPDGTMKTGEYEITDDDIAAWTVDDAADGKVDGKAQWHGINYVIPTGAKAGYSLYFDNSTDHDGDRGEQLVGRQEWSVDGWKVVKFFTSNGAVDELAIYGGYLYENGELYTAEDGDKFALYSLNGKSIKSYTLKNGVPTSPVVINKDEAKDTYIIVNRDGKAQKGYTGTSKKVTLDDGSVYDVQNYVAKEAAE